MRLTHLSGYSIGLPVRSSTSSTSWGEYSPYATMALKTSQLHKQLLSNKAPIHSWVERGSHTGEVPFPVKQHHTTAPKIRTQDLLIQSRRPYIVTAPQRPVLKRKEKKRKQTTLSQLLIQSQFGYAVASPQGNPYSL